MLNESNNIKGYDNKVQGESFTRWYSKKDGGEWGTTQGGYWVLKDRDGDTVSSGDLVKSEDNTYIGLTVPKADTASLVGSYSMFAHLTDTTDATFDDVFVEYELQFKEEKADA